MLYSIVTSCRILAFVNVTMVSLNALVPLRISCRGQDRIRTMIGYMTWSAEHRYRVVMMMKSRFSRVLNIEAILLSTHLAPRPAKLLALAIFSFLAASHSRPVFPPLLASRSALFSSFNVLAFSLGSITINSSSAFFL